MFGERAPVLTVVNLQTKLLTRIVFNVSFEEMVRAILIAESALSLFPLMSISSRELLEDKASPIAAPPAGPKPFQLMSQTFSRTFS